MLRGQVCSNCHPLSPSPSPAHHRIPLSTWVSLLHDCCSGVSRIIPCLLCFQSEASYEMASNSEKQLCSPAEGKTMSSHATNAHVKVSPSSVCSREKKKWNSRISESILILLLSSGHSIWNIHRRVFVFRKRSEKHDEYSRWFVLSGVQRLSQVSDKSPSAASQDERNH